MPRGGLWDGDEEGGGARRGGWLLRLIAKKNCASKGVSDSFWQGTNIVVFGAAFFYMFFAVDYFTFY